MGQYYKAVNLTKKEVLNPHTFGDGAKLMEFGPSGDGMMAGLAILLADGNNRGGGDLRSENPVIGSWAGDKIVITGDYADEGRFTKSKKNLYDVSEKYKDVSEDVICALAEDSYEKERLRERLNWMKKRLSDKTRKAVYG